MKRSTIKEAGEAFELALMAASKDLGVETSNEVRKLAGTLFARWLKTSGVAPEGTVDEKLMRVVWQEAGRIARGE